LVSFSTPSSEAVHPSRGEFFIQYILIYSSPGWCPAGRDIKLSSFGGGTRRVEVDKKQSVFYIKSINLSTPAFQAPVILCD
jgi:hypothetical protein